VVMGFGAVSVLIRILQVLWRQHNVHEGRMAELSKIKCKCRSDLPPWGVHPIEDD